MLLYEFPIFRHRYLSLRLLDVCPVATGVRKPSNEVHKGIDVGEFYIINHKGHSKGSDNQLNQQTAFFVASHGCWCNKFFDCFILQHKTSTSLCWFKWQQGPPTDNKSFQLQTLNIFSPCDSNQQNVDSFIIIMSKMTRETPEARSKLERKW